MLKPEIQAQILALKFSEHRSVRSIAREVGVDRKSVADVIDRRSVRTVPQEAATPRKSILDPYKPVIQEKLLRDPAMPATVIHQSIRRLGYSGSERHVRTYVTTVRVSPRPREAFLKLSFEPGQCAQVDWGEFGDVFGDGVKMHAFVMVLCYSRRIYVEFTRCEKFEDFIRCHENAFRFFGSRTKECWYDNLATAVTERLGRLVRFNARFHTYCGHHGFTPYACTPASGNEKGRVEDGVKYIRSSFWPDRVFRDFADLNAQCAEWMSGTANSREHRSTRKVPDLVFEHEEKQHMLALNPHLYGTDEVLSRGVSPQFHLTYETNQYSVPWTLVGLVVTMRTDAESIRIFYGDKLVAHHERHYGKHRIFTTPEHQVGLLERKPGADHHAWQVAHVKEAGEALEKYLKLITAGHRSLRSEVRRLVALITVYGAEAVNQATAGLLVRGVIGVENLELMLKVQGSPVIQPEPLNFQSQKLNRMTGAPDLSQYDALLFDCADEPPADIPAQGESRNDPRPQNIAGDADTTDPTDQGSSGT